MMYQMKILDEIFQSWNVNKNDLFIDQSGEYNIKTAQEWAEGYAKIYQNGLIEFDDVLFELNTLLSV